MAKYEAHITFDKVHEVALKDPDSRLRKAAELSGWQYSAIDDDPIMGQKPYCYLTAYYHDAEYLLLRVQTATRFLAGAGIPSLREKIERIVYDTKTGVNELVDNPPPGSPIFFETQ